MPAPSRRPEAARPSTAVPRFCNWLPYRSYDSKRKIFFNAGSRGFVLEATPMIGASERSGEIGRTAEGREDFEDDLTLVAVGFGRAGRSGLVRREPGGNG